MAKHFLTVADLSLKELMACLRLAHAWKHGKSGKRAALEGKTLALVFEKPSVRTRVSFEVAIRQLGGSSIYLGPEDAQLNRRELVKDVARTLSRYVDGIVCRTFRHRDVEELAEFASVPVINGLSDLHHPCQALADVMTILEHFGRLKGLEKNHGRLRPLELAYIGDGNNVLHSLAQAASPLGINLRAATPERYAPDEKLWNEAVRNGEGGLEIGRDPRAAARGADIIYTDVWTSMGQEPERKARQQAFRSFQVNKALLALAKPRCVVMHCLPAHRGEEITNDVIEGPRSIVFEQAENRLHAQKGLLEFLFGTQAATRKGGA